MHPPLEFAPAAASITGDRSCFRLSPGGILMIERPGLLSPPCRRVKQAGTHNTPSLQPLHSGLGSLPSLEQMVHFF